ncbi:MAG: putative baseplate assembly protein [Acidimicrobiia bacterium]
MALPVPNLDDRRFQDLVDDAKRMVMERCPEWTDHNVSDPGVTLIETFAFMVDQLLYRVNQVPDRLYVKFLDLIGVQLFPPTPARTGITFWLSAPATDPIEIPTGTKAATRRTDGDEPVVFATVEDLAVVPCSLQVVATRGAKDELVTVRDDALDVNTPVHAFSTVPEPDDTILFGLSDPVPGCAVQISVRCRIDGVGVDPDHPPLAWEAFDGDTWHACTVGSDSTGGLNRDGDVVVHVPAGHRAAVIEERRAGWLRARVLEPDEGFPAYSSSPVVSGLAAATVGGTVDAIHAEVVEYELLGASEGVAGQRFKVQRGPMVAGAAPTVVEVGGDAGWAEWTQVDAFTDSTVDDQHYVLDAAAGEVRFGPALREADGTLTQRGAVPPKGSYVRMRQYAIGGGRRGNVRAGAISTLKSSIPFVAGVENRAPAVGGVEGESLASAKDRGPILLRTRSRAVTAEDFEFLTRQAAPEVARVRCLAAGEGLSAGTVRVLVVPAAPTVEGAIAFEDLLPAPSTLVTVSAALDEARLVGTRVLVEPPRYRGVTVVARLRAAARASAARIEKDALRRLDEYLNPLTGGPDGEGWPWGRPVQAGEIFAALQGVRGVDLVDDVRLFGANPVTGERGQATQRIELEPDELVFSYQHQLRVEVPE